MHQLEIYTSKDEPEEVYWITQQEAADIFDQTEAKKGFISVPRLRLMKNIREIKSFGIPPFIRVMEQKGYEVQFDNSDRPVIQCEGYILCYEGKDGGWKRYETKIKRNYKKFEDLVGTVKRLN